MVSNNVLLPPLIVCKHKNKNVIYSNLPACEVDAFVFRVFSLHFLFSFHDLASDTVSVLSRLHSFLHSMYGGNHGC